MGVHPQRQGLDIAFDDDTTTGDNGVYTCDIDGVRIVIEVRYETRGGRCSRFRSVLIVMGMVMTMSAVRVTVTVRVVMRVVERFSVDVRTKIMSCESLSRMRVAAECH